MLRDVGVDERHETLHVEVVAVCCIVSRGCVCVLWCGKIELIL